MLFKASSNMANICSMGVYFSLRVILGKLLWAFYFDSIILPDNSTVEYICTVT